LFIFLLYTHIHSGGESFEYDILPLWSDILSELETYIPSVDNKHPFVFWILLCQALFLLLHIRSSMLQHSSLVLHNEMLQAQVNDLVAINLAQEIAIDGLNLAVDLLLDNDAAQLQVLNMILSG